MKWALQNYLALKETFRAAESCEYGHRIVHPDVVVAAFTMSNVETLLQLQGRVKRDPSAYFREFEQQLQHYKVCVCDVKHVMYQASLSIFKLQPDQSDETGFCASINFLSHVAHCYPAHSKGLADEWVSLLETQGLQISKVCSR